MSAIARALKVSRPHLSTTSSSTSRSGISSPAEATRDAPRDAALLGRIRVIVDARGSYGYRRVTALLNRQGEPRVNHKRVYRVMRSTRLLLAKYTGRTGRAHDGKVMTPASNMRWCSDSFEVRCGSGERVHVAFAMDCCDREILAWVARPHSLLGEDVRDLMAQSIEHRFGEGSTRAPAPLQWLSDNGPQYTAHETRDFGHACGLAVCTTPAYSPESNGMAEAMVKTFKRDYVYLAELADLADADSLLAALPRWFDDYNHHHPHRALGMKSPREFRAAMQALLQTAD